MSGSIVINGLTISTDPSRWSGLTAKEISTLMLNPVDMTDFNKRGRENRADPNAAYLGTVFMSAFPLEYKFFVRHIGYTRPEENSYYVLARPLTDSKTYSPPM